MKPHDPTPPESVSSDWRAKDPWAQAVGDRIAERRRALGLTQAALADALSLTHQAVSKWERGESLPDVALLMPLADLLQVSVDGLLRGPAERPAPAERTERWRWPFRASPAGAPPADSPSEDVGDGHAAAAAPSLPPPALPQILAMAPFLPCEALDRLVLGLGGEGVSWPEAAQLAPFLSRAALDHLICQLSPDSPSLEAMVELAPFVSQTALERLVAGVPDGRWSWDTVAQMAPFLSPPRLAAMVAPSV